VQRNLALVSIHLSSKITIEPLFAPVLRAKGVEVSTSGVGWFNLWAAISKEL